MINEDILKQIEQTDRFIGRELQEDPELLVNVKHCIVERIQGYDFGGKKGCYAIVRQEYANGLGGPLVVMTTEPRLQGLLETAMGGMYLKSLATTNNLSDLSLTLETYTFDFWGYVVASSSQASPSVQEVLANTPWPVAQEIRSYFEDPDFTLFGLVSVTVKYFEPDPLDPVIYAYPANK